MWVTRLALARNGNASPLFVPGSPRPCISLLTRPLRWSARLSLTGQAVPTYSPSYERVSRPWSSLTRLTVFFPTLAECMAYVEAWGLQGVTLRVLDFEGETISLMADNNALFLATLAECRAMSHEGRLTRMGKRYVPQRQARARTRAALGA